MSYPASQDGPKIRRKPALVNVRVIAWDEGLGIYGLIQEFDDGENICEPWGGRAETEYAADLRRQDIRSLSRPAAR